MAQRAFDGSRLYRVMRWILRQLNTAYFQLSVSNAHHVPRRGGAILAANHPSLLDGVLLLIVSPRPVRFLVAEEMYFHRILHRLFVCFGCIPIYKTKRCSGQALEAAVEALRQGDVIGIFPEGTTKDEGRMRVAKKGVALLALKSGAPIVPVGIVGSRDAFPLERRIPRPGRIVLSFGAPLRYPVRGEAMIPEPLLGVVLEEIRGTILRTMRWAEAARSQPADAWPLKRLQTALSALVVVPVVGVLSLTANPSLDPLPPREVAV